MKYFTKVIDTIFQDFSKWFVVFFFSILTLFSLFFTAYYIPDRALFRFIRLSDFAGIAGSLILISLFIALSYRYNIKKRYLLCLYSMASVFFIVLVPLMPFSDMLSVYTIAANGLKGDLTYLQNYPNNLPIVLVFTILLKIYKDPAVIKVAQVFCNLIIIILTTKIYKKIFHSSDDKIITVFLICNIPTILYTNHVYSDIAATLFSIVALYYLLCFDFDKRKRWHIIVISFSLLLCFIIRPNCIIYIIAAIIFLLYQKEYKFLFFTIVSFMIFYLGYQILSSVLVTKSEIQYPIWSWIQMGLNKDTIGFQDGTHSSQWQLQDVFIRIKELRVMGSLKLFVKKNLWMWSEGTYQARRYGFAYDDAIYKYDTFYTNHLADKGLFFDALNSTMKGYYFLIILLCVIGVFFLDKKDSKTNFLLHIIIGFFIFYTIWEIKSRYIYILYPIFSILAVYGLERLRKIFQ